MTPLAMPEVVQEFTRPLPLSAPPPSSLVLRGDQVMFEPQLLTIPSGTVLGGQLKLVCDIFAAIDWNADGVLIRSELFDEDGYGGTYADAWNDFLSSLSDKLASLEKHEAKLADADRKVLAQLRKSIAVAA